ncbi:MAG: VCBS repeat-containing protein, partial [Candidatus Aegiribacteria sp.]|nr:VCBS repeat-containing protein [Candidatus Aegiribacteria sp.]
MYCTALTLSIFLIAVHNDFEDFLSIRDFDSALESAGDSDSLSAVVFREAGNYSMAAMLFEKAFEEKPSAGLFTAMWESVASSTEHSPSLTAAFLREQILELEGVLSWGPEDLVSLIESSSALGDSLFTDSLVQVLVEGFPESPEASEVIGWEFYDMLYPVWYDDSARIKVLGEFLDDWGDRSDLWRSRAWQYTLSAVIETADSSNWKDYLNEWLEACPEDPQVFLSGSALHIDRDSSWSEALDLAEKGLALIKEGWAPWGMPDEEWQLTGPALEAGLQFRRLFAMAGSGRRQEALMELATAISDTDFNTDDYHTEASLYWLCGRLSLENGDSLEALNNFADAAVSGEIRNQWSGEAIDAMDSLLPPDISPVQWAREQREYSGPVFTDATHLLGPDSMLAGSRVSWCDWNCDGFPDLFAGHSLFQNFGGSSFRDVTSEAGLDSCRGNGGIWGDINGDGLPDLVTSGNPVQVFINKHGTLEEVTEGIGITKAESSVEGVALLDWNADGWLDLYLASYERTGNLDSGTKDAFYFGGEYGFIKVGDSIGMVPFLEEHLCGRGVSPCDFDLDGDIDTFVSNYRLQENFLWENEDGTAVNSALHRGAAGTNTSGWWGHTIGSAWGDFDNDGDWDLFSANLAHPRYIPFSDRSMFYEQQDGYFTDMRSSAGIRFEETHSNPLWGDFNNDGWLDLFITSVYPDRRSFLYLNLGNGRFEDVTRLSGTRIFNGWGAATADYNLDGRLDLAVGSGEGPILLENISTGGNWILV